MPITTRDKRPYLVAALAGTFALLSIDLLLPFNWDNEIYQSMAMDLIRFGQLPYLGSWDQNFPGIVYIHGLSIVLFGNSELGFRLLDLALHLGMAWMLFSLLCRWVAPRTALLSVLLYMLHYIANGFMMAGQRDEFAALFLLVGTVLLFAASETRPRQSSAKYLAGFGAGTALTLMFTIRPTFGTFALVGLAFLLSSARNRAALAVSFIAGVSCVLLALFLPYLIRPGGIEQFYLSTVRYNLDIYGGIHSPITKVLYEIRQQKLFLVSGFLGILLALWPSHRRFGNFRLLWQRVDPPSLRVRLLLAGYGFSALISLFVMGKYLPYHFEPLILVLVPFGALGIESLIVAMPGKIWQGAVIAALLLYIIFRVYPLFLIRPFVHNVLTGEPLSAAQNAMVPEDAGFRRDVDAAVAAYIDKTAPTGERIACATLTAGVRMRTTRQCVSRFTTFYPLSISSPGGGHPDFQQAWRKEYVNSLRYARAYYLVIGNGPAEIVDWVHTPPSQSIHDIEGFDSLILPHYRLDTAIGGYSILKRRE